MLYPREALERVGGFDEVAVTGEDIDLGFRTRASGTPLVGAPEALVWHAVDELTVSERIRSNGKWQHLAYVVKQHPELRRQCCMGIWWKREHLRAVLMLVGAVGVLSRRQAFALALLPYFTLEAGRFGRTPVGRLRSIRRMPEFWLIDLAETATFARGSVRYRTLLL
jgi:GT2 family glycosyltransferase